MNYLSHLSKITRIKGHYPDHNMLRLSSAERTEPFPKIMWKKFLDNLRETDVRYYPDLDRALCTLSNHTTVPAECLTIGHGSDSVIKNVFECFVNERSKVITTDPCFPMYKIYGQIRNAEVHAVPYKDKRVDVSGIIDAIDDNTSLVVLSNPSSPIGDLIHYVEDIVKAARDKDCMILIDEAYGEFANMPSMVEKYRSYSNLIVTKTFSKAVGSAGIRFGYAVSKESTANILAKVKSIYEITGPTIRWMEMVIHNWDLVLEYTNQVAANKYIVTRELERQGYEIHHGYCNWFHTTKINFHESIDTKQCTLPWDDRQWTRLCIPSDQESLELLYR